MGLWGEGLQVSCYSSWLKTLGCCVSAVEEEKKRGEERDEHNERKGTGREIEEWIEDEEI